MDQQPSSNCKTSTSTPLPLTVNASTTESIFGVQASFESNYIRSGDVVEDTEKDFILEEENVEDVKFNRATVLQTLDKVKNQLGLQYSLQKFQVETVFHLVNDRNVVLIAPTGSGKTDLIYIALKVKEILSGVELVVLGSEPTQNIIKDKLVNPRLPTASVGMSGNIDVSSNREVELSHTVEELKSGAVKVIFGYQESWSHPTGEEILEALSQDGKVGFLVFDEAHQNLEKFWGNFRPEMRMGPSEMRLQAGRPGVLLMSATATSEDCLRLKKLTGIRNNIVTVRKSPVMDNIKFVTIQRPSNRKGSGITSTVDGLSGKVVDVMVEEGMLHPILQCFLELWCLDVENGRIPKTGIIFSENTDDLVNVQKYLFCRLGDQGRKKPWVLVTSNTGSSTKKRMRIRSEMGGLHLYLATSVLMLGVNFKQVDIVVICRPYPLLHSLLQAAGRGGRKLEDGRRKQVVLYQLFNNEDIVVGRKGMEEETKKFCQTSDCLRKALKSYFADESDEQLIWCCGNCDKE